MYVYSDELELKGRFCTKGRARNEFLGSPRWYSNQILRSAQGDALIPIVDIGQGLKVMDLQKSLENQSTVISMQNDYTGLNVIEFDNNGHRARMMSAVYYLFLDNNISNRFEKFHPLYLDDIVNSELSYAVTHDTTRVKHFKLLSDFGERDADFTGGGLFKHPGRNLIIQPFTDMDYILFFDLDNDRSFAIHQFGSLSFDDELPGMNEDYTIAADGSIVPNEIVLHFSAAACTESFFMITYFAGDYSIDVPEMSKAAPELLFFDWDGNFLKSVKLDTRVSNISYDERRKILYGVDRENDRIVSFDLTWVVPDNQRAAASDEVPVIHIDDNAAPLYETLSVDNLIESYKYVPLSSVPGSMVMGGCPVKVSDQYLMVSGMLFRPDFRLFRDNGQFIGDAVVYGRGPDEITTVVDYLVDYARKELVVISNGKILEYGFESKKYRAINLDGNGENTVYSRFNARLENGDFVILPANDYEDDEPYRPALIFFDSLFQMSDTLIRYAPKHRMIDDVTTGITLGKVLENTGNGVLYQDMAGDTVFRVGADRQLVPEFVIDIPQKLKMTVGESERAKIIIRGYEVSKDYICLSYQYEGATRFGIWSKETGQLLFRYVNPNVRHFIKVLLDGKVLEMPIGEFQPNSNSFVSSVPAAQMKHVFPNLKDDDNPVAIEITLK